MDGRHVLSTRLSGARAGADGRCWRRDRLVQRGQWWGRRAWAELHSSYPYYRLCQAMIVLRSSMAVLVAARHRMIGGSCTNESVKRAHYCVIT